MTEAAVRDSTAVCLPRPSFHQPARSHYSADETDSLPYYGIFASIVHRGKSNLVPPVRRPLDPILFRPYLG